MTTWISDANGNKCSVEYFGTEELAKAALDSLIDCRNCVNCSRCSDCSDCSGCSDCSDCSRCSHCSRCSGCSDCSDCSRCSHCSRCSGCSDCSRCSHLAKAWDRENIQALPAEGEAPAQLGPPPIPVIEDIHAKVYEAVSQPGALDMSSWHACETTHCRAGWVVALAGAEGKALESFHNTDLAARLIYSASGFDINPARFHDSNEAAMADMKRLAAA
jgi:hypothetical protein